MGKATGMSSERSDIRRVPESMVSFGPFRVDLDGGRLWRGGQVVHLRPKTWEVLCLFVANPGQLLTKQEILAAVWGDVAIGDTMPSISATELRRALDDDARSPRYIETVHGRGFRFIASVAPAEAAAVPAAAGSSHAGMPFVGRGTELRDLEDLLSPRDSRCRVALISGEAGIGKTTLVEHFLGRLRDRGAMQPRPWLLGRGQCQAHFGEGYPFLPVLGALRTMSQARHDVVALMRSTAPSWLAHLPDLASAEEVEAARRCSEGATQSRAMEEMFALLRALGPVVWVLEDLHWADEATLELVSLVAENVALEDFSLIGTVRLAEAVAGARGVARTRRELRRRGRCREYMLEGLGETHVDQYLAARFPEMRRPDGLAERLLARTSGNPFFLVQTVNHLADAGVLVASGAWSPSEERNLHRALDAVPETLREMVQGEIAALGDDERRALEAVSLAGLEADAATAAHALEEPVERVDAILTDLVRRTSLLSRIGETLRPDGVVSGRYAFRHALYQKVLYDDQAPAARRDAHCRIGRALVAAFGDRAGEISSVLADHFERGGDREQAVAHHRVAAEDSSRRHASREAALHLRRALALLPGLPDREAREATVLAELGKVLPALEGFGDPDVLALYLRARSLQAEGADAGAGFTTMAGLLLANLMQGHPAPALELARELLDIAANQATPETRALAEMLMGAAVYHRGDLAGTLDHAERSLAAGTRGVALGPIDQRCTTLLMSGAALWQAGHLEEAVTRAEQALERAREGVDPFNRVLALQALAAIHQWRGDAPRALGVAGQLAREAREQGITEAEACAELVEAWARFVSGEVELAAHRLERGLATLREHGTMMQSVYLLAVAVEVLAGLGRRSEARSVLEEACAMIDEGAARWWEPELHRLRALLLLGAEDPGAAHEAERSLQRALAIASEQGANSLCLRAAIALAELRRQRGHDPDSLDLLETSLGRIRGGAETRDVSEARRVLRPACETPA